MLNNYLVTIKTKTEILLIDWQCSEFRLLEFAEEINKIDGFNVRISEINTVFKFETEKEKTKFWKQVKLIQKKKEVELEFPKLIYER